MLIRLLFHFRITKTCHNTRVWSLDNHGLTGEAAGTMQHPWGWWFLNQQKSQITASSELVSLETDCRRSSMAFQVSSHKCLKKTCKKANSVNIDLEKDQGQEHWEVSLHPTFLFVYIKFKETGSYILSSWKESIAFVVLLWLHSCPPLSLVSFFLITSFRFPFSSSLPISSTLSQETHRTRCQHLQLFTPFPRTPGPAHSWPAQLLSG